MSLLTLLARVRSRMRQLSPAVRAETAYTLGRERLVRDASRAALAGERWLGPSFGAGFDERVVEYPWVYATLGQVRQLLDVGSALNHAEHIARLASRGIRVVFLNPYPDEGFRSAEPPVRYLRADVRSPSLQAGAFAAVTCISTLEHLGCDNTRYGGPARESHDEPARAREAAMRRVRDLLAPGGRLLFTVPFGRREDHGWFVQLDAALLDEAIAAFAPSAARATYFRHADGWREVGPSDCALDRYGATTCGATAVACVELSA